MTIPVMWVSNHQPDIIARFYWDQAFLETLLADFTHHTEFVDADGAIVVVPARHHVEDLKWLNDNLSRYQWVLLILTGDEEAVFPWKEVVHPNMLIWVQTPKPGYHDGVHRRIGDMWPPHAVEYIAPSDKPLDFFYAGQVNNSSRRRLVQVLEGLPGGETHPSQGFTLGLDPKSYYDGLNRAKIAPCPSGIFSPDTFRLFEALEAGCVPVAEYGSPVHGNLGYWPYLFDIEFPLVSNWSEFPALMNDLLDEWPRNANRIFAKWQNHKLDWARWLRADLERLGASLPVLHEHITVLVPTSPVPSNPDTSHIEQTVQSVRERLPRSEIIIMIDGPRDLPEERVAAYDEYIRQLLYLTNTWGVRPIVHEEHLHQAEMTRRALEIVKTELVLFVEHDTPLIGEIPWDGLVATIASREANAIRLHHETSVLEPHKHLMLDEEPRLIQGVPLLRTAQWSQRPHLAAKEFYVWLLDTWFGPDTKTMIEDRFYGVVDQYWKLHGEQGWEKFKLFLYAPEGDMKRSDHTDARGDDPKGEMVYPYWDGPWADQ